MAKVWTLGLSKIEVGAIAGDGGMGTSLSVLGSTYQGTCNITVDDASETEHYSEENEDPEIIVTRAGKTVLNFSIMDADMTVLQTLLGGTITGSAATEVLALPNKAVNIEKSIKITPEKGHVISIPRAKISAKHQGAVGKEGILLLEVKATVLVPTKSGVAKLSYSVIPS
jgi:hypothetical protein